MERFGLRNDQWERIKDILPGPAILKVGIWAGLILFFGFSSVRAGW